MGRVVQGMIKNSLTQKTCSIVLELVTNECRTSLAKNATVSKSNLLFVSIVTCQQRIYLYYGIHRLYIVIV